MNVVKRQIFTQILTDLSTTYARFLVDHHLTDNAISIVAFYTACEDMVSDDPIPDEELQVAILTHLRNVKNKALDELSEKIENAFVSLSQIPILA